MPAANPTPQPSYAERPVNIPAPPRARPINLVHRGLNQLTKGGAKALIERGSADIRADLLLWDVDYKVLPTEVFEMLCIYRALYIDCLAVGGMADVMKWECERQMRDAIRWARRHRRTKP